MVDTYLDGGLSHIHLQLPNDGGIACIIRTVDRSIPLSFMDDIRTAALGERLVVRTLMDQLLARSLGFVSRSLVRSFSGGEAIDS